MSLDCTTTQYEKLYARWLRNPGGLLDLADYQPGQRLLDLCGGSGAITQEALRRGAPLESLLLLDLNPRCSVEGVEQIKADANRLGEFAVGYPHQPPRLRSFDLIVCRQALAYIESLGNLALWVSALLKPEGKFVFNTFTNPKFVLKSYQYEGRRFFEASGFWNRTVWHVQASPLLGVDVTRFYWYSEEELHQVLDPFFRCWVVVDDGKSQRWVCKKRE